MTKIPLGGNLYATVDDADAKIVSKYAWHLGTGGYAIRRGMSADGPAYKKTIRMHREIMKTPRGMETDHIDGDGLNNTRSNLRIVTKHQNSTNLTRVRSDNQSGFCGLYLCVGRKRPWRAQYRHFGKLHHVGYFYNTASAHAAIVEARRLAGYLNPVGAVRQNA